MAPAEWGDNDVVIACQPWVEPMVGAIPTALGPYVFAVSPIHPRSIKKECELCHAEIAASPVSVERVKQKDAHLICVSCQTELGEQLVIAGRVHNNEFIRDRKTK